MVDSYEHLMKPPIDPDTAFPKDGSQASDSMDEINASIAAQSRAANQSLMEKRYNRDSTATNSGYMLMNPKKGKKQ